MVTKEDPTHDGICPLCNKPAQVKLSQQFDGDVVICERCGYFRIEHGVQEQFKEQLNLLSGLTRKSSTPRPSVETRLTLTHSNIPELLETSGLPESLLDHLDITLQYVKGHQHRSDSSIEYRTLANTDYPLVFAHDANEFLHFLQSLANQELLEEPPGRDPMHRTAFRITPKGWQRLRELAKIGRDSNLAFVAMSFSPELQPAWKDGIKKALEELKYNPIRIDKTDAEDKIDDRIIAEIRRSGLLIADFTGHRGGVYFEAGYALGLGIPVIWTCRKADIEYAHFDTRQYQHLLWETPEELYEKLLNHIAARIPGRFLP